MKKRFLRMLALVSKKLHDPYTPKAYVWRMLFVPKPTQEAPFPCILLTLSNGHSKIMIRFDSLEQYDQAFRLLDEDRANINNALMEANQEADRIEEDIRLVLQKRHLPAGAKIVNTSTGEVLAEAEQILKQQKNEP